MAHAPPRSYQRATSVADRSLRKIPADGDLRLNSAIMFSRTEFDSSACDSRCGAAFARISDACWQKSLDTESARSRAMTCRFRSRISESILTIISSDSSLEPAPPASMPRAHCRYFHERGPLRGGALWQLPRGGAQQQHL